MPPFPIRIHVDPTLPDGVIVVKGKVTMKYVIPVCLRLNDEPPEEIEAVVDGPLVIIRVQS